MNHATLFILGLFFLSVTCLSGQSSKKIQDWNQFRGPDRDGKSLESGLLKKWPDKGPRKLWMVEEIGEGFSPVVISKEIVYITGAIDDGQDYLTAFSRSGKKLWQVSYGESWDTSVPGVRIAPTITDGKIYLISGMGKISCLNAKNGKQIWSMDAYDTFDGEYGSWGIAENLLVTDNKVIYTPGGNETTMVALDKNDGSTIWTSVSLDDETAYASPIVIKRKGRKIIVNVTASYILGVDARDGKILWKVNYMNITAPGEDEGSDINCNMPVYKDGRIFITSGYDHTSVMFDLSEDGSSIKKVWQQEVMDTHHGNVVEVDGYIYGSNWINNRNGNWVCLDWQTGKVMYEKKWINKGSILYADGMLYCYEEKRGNIALVEASPKDFKVISSFKVNHGSGPHWAYPVIQDGVLYIRHGETLAAYNISNKS